MDAQNFVDKAVVAIVEYVNSRLDKSDVSGRITTADVFVVWQCKVLKNNKAMLSTNNYDGMYYEFTWNGEKEEGYLDAYKKWENVVVK